MPQVIERPIESLDWKREVLLLHTAESAKHEAAHGIVAGAMTHQRRRLSDGTLTPEQEWSAAGWDYVVLNVPGRSFVEAHTRYANPYQDMLVFLAGPIADLCDKFGDIDAWDTDECAEPLSWLLEEGGGDPGSDATRVAELWSLITGRPDTTIDMTMSSILNFPVINCSLTKDPEANYDELLDIWLTIAASEAVDDVVAILRRYRAGWEALTEHLYQATLAMPEESTFVVSRDLPPAVKRLLPRVRRDYRPDALERRDCAWGVPGLTAARLARWREFRAVEHGGGGAAAASTPSGMPLLRS